MFLSLILLMSGVASASEAPAHSVVFLTTDGISEGQYCAGILISKNLVLTAAHCMGNPIDTTILFGSNPSTPTDTRIVVMGEHDPDFSWNRPKGLHDLAVLRFIGLAPTGYEPVQLSKTSLTEGASLQSIGYGNRTETGGPLLHTTTLKLSDTQFSDTEDLATVENGAEPICRGDSGGMVFGTSQGKTILLGVVTAGMPDHTVSDGCWSEMVVTDIHKEEKFLKQAIADLGI